MKKNLSLYSKLLKKEYLHSEIPIYINDLYANFKNNSNKTTFEMPIKIYESSKSIVQLTKSSKFHPLVCYYIAYSMYSVNTYTCLFFFAYANIFLIDGLLSSWRFNMKAKTIYLSVENKLDCMQVVNSKDEKDNESKCYKYTYTYTY